MRRAARDFSRGQSFEQLENAHKNIVTYEIESWKFDVYMHILGELDDSVESLEELLENRNGGVLAGRQAVQAKLSELRGYRENFKRDVQAALDRNQTVGDTGEVAALFQKHRESSFTTEAVQSLVKGAPFFEQPAEAADCKQQ